MTEPLKVFVGCAPDGLDAESAMVLEYTLRKKTSVPVDIEWMILSKDPSSFWYSNPETGEGWVTQTWATPFSGFRWAIPARCNFKGKALYMDSDMIINADLKDLFDTEFQPGKIILSKNVPGRIDVALWNCEQAEYHLLPLNRLRSLPNAHQRMMQFIAENPQLVQHFDRQWNNFDGENDKLEDIKILHYTSMNHQPQLKYALKRLQENGQGHWFDGKVEKHWRDDIIQWFDAEYQAALDAGYKVENYIPENTYGSITKESQKDYKNAHSYVR